MALSPLKNVRTIVDMKLNLYKPILISILYQYHSFDTVEEEHRQDIIEFLSTNLSPFSRNNTHGHITVSAIVVDMTIPYVLLIWHEQLQRWLQPGGHCEEESDATTYDGASRELIEETNINIQSINLIQKSPFDIDIHVIPSSNPNNIHFHYDLRYLFILKIDMGKVRAQNLRWYSIDEIASCKQESLSRFAKKLLDFRGEEKS